MVKLEIEVLDDNLLRVKVGGEVHRVTEVHLTFDGPVPILTMSHALQELEHIEVQAKGRTYLDGTPT